MYINSCSYPVKNLKISFTSRKLDNGFISKIQLEEELKNASSIEEISQKYNISSQRISVLLRVFGLTTPNKRHCLSETELNLRMPKLIEQGATISKMSESIPRYQIEKWLKINLPQGLREYRKQQKTLLYASSLSNEEIAKISGVTVRSIRSKRAKYGYSSAKLKEEKNLELIKNAMNHSLKIKQIAQEVNMDAGTCSKYIKKYGLLEIFYQKLGQQIIQRIQEGTNKRQLAKELNISQNALKTLMKKCEIEDAFELHKKAVIEKVHILSREGFKVRQIAEKLGISSRAIFYYLKKFN